MDLNFLLGLLLSPFLVPFFSESGKILARRLFGEKQKSLPDSSSNVFVVVIFVKL